MSKEAWLDGPVDGVPGLLMPVAHSLIQAREDLLNAASMLTTAELWLRPGGAASIGFHLRHVPGTIDRLLTYARGEALSDEQLAALRREVAAGPTPPDAAALLDAVDRSIEAALDAVRGTQEEDLLAHREVGRAKLPSTTLGLLFHAAEHTQRHTGQVITTVKIIRGLDLTAETGA